MTKQLKWRLSKLPTPDEVLKLVNDKLITKEEARDILFSEEKKEEVIKENLETEIKFLRKLVEKLSQNNTEVVETIKLVQKPYYQYDWYKPYVIWCASGTSNFGGSGTTQYLSEVVSNANFSDIKTF